MARRFTWWWWKPVLLVLLALVIARGGACGACSHAAQPPDERLGGHFRELCTIAEHGIDDPQAGVRKMMRYYGDHGPDMLEDFGATLVVIERIQDDAAHDRRARVARDRIQAPLLACAESLDEFAQAIESDPEASELLDRGVTRLARTLEILFSAEGRQRLPLGPRALLQRLAPASRP